MRTYLSDSLFDRWKINLSYSDDYSQSVVKYDDAIITPSGAYDSEGKLIEGSSLKRGMPNKTGQHHVQSVPEFIRGDFEYLDDDVYYISYANSGHWGHLLTETFARSHSLETHPSNVYYSTLHGSGSMGVVSEYYSQHKYVPLTTAVRVRKVQIPIPSMINRFLVSEKHIEICRNMGDYFGRSTIKNDKVYLSRTKMRSIRGNTRWTQGETELEQMLSEDGWTIVHLQDLTVRDQLGILEGADILCGCIGSAFHNLMMTRKNPRKVLYLTCDENETNPNYALHDRILGNDSTYIDCQIVTNKQAENRKIISPKETFECINSH